MFSRHVKGWQTQGAQGRTGTRGHVEAGAWGIREPPEKTLIPGRVPLSDDGSRGRRIRLNKTEARLLASEAKARGVPESEVLRGALRIMGRVRARERNVHNLIALISPEEIRNPPKTIKFRLK